MNEYFTETAKPRQIAHGYVQAFLKGEGTDMAMADEIAHYDALARTHARNAAAMIIHHARKVEADRNYKVPPSIWPSVRTYLVTRGRW